MKQTTVFMHCIYPLMQTYTHAYMWVHTSQAFHATIPKEWNRMPLSLHSSNYTFLQNVAQNSHIQTCNPTYTYTYIQTVLGELLPGELPQVTSLDTFPPVISSWWFPPDLENLLERMKRLDFSKPVTCWLTPGSNDYTNLNTNPTRLSRHVT